MQPATAALAPGHALASIHHSPFSKAGTSFSSSTAIIFLRFVKDSQAWCIGASPTCLCTNPLHQINSHVHVLWLALCLPGMVSRFLFPNSRVDVVCSCPSTGFLGGINCVCCAAPTRCSRQILMPHLQRLILFELDDWSPLCAGLLLLHCTCPVQTAESCRNRCCLPYFDCLHTAPVVVVQLAV